MAKINTRKSLKDIGISISYNSDRDNILKDFYIPTLSVSTGYKRIGGYFSSTAFALAARGLSQFLINGGHMQLIVNHVLQEGDKKMLEEITHSPKVAEKILIKEMDAWSLENKIIKNHVAAFGWMLKNNLLELKVAVTLEPEIFHQKVGIMEDKFGNEISFSGSNNESASGWQVNIEEFKVFRQWIPGQENYLKADKEKFGNFWNGTCKRAVVVSAPDAIKEKLIKIAPKRKGDIEIDNESTSELFLTDTKDKIVFRDYQKEAIKKWVEHNYRGIFEMATGTGKTFTAIGCLERLYESEKKLLTVIACPTVHLSTQWKDELAKFGIKCDTVIANSSNRNWKNIIRDAIADLNSNISDKLIIFTTHATFSSEIFINFLKIANSNLFLIADEVHGVGAEARKVGLIKDYLYRLGLSATPKRWFDLEGTEELFDYFGGTVFEFTLKKAINTINPITGKTYLTPYEYKPYFIILTDDELETYELKTKKIARAFHKSRKQKERNKWFNLLLIERQKIIKNAINKFNVFEQILADMDEIKHCLIYCSPEQIKKVQNILNNYKKNIIQHKFTEIEGVHPKNDYEGSSERDFLLNKLATGEYHVLVAINCLDEGVDVPQVNKAVILSSTGNPRQYIQRRGRILRHYPGKNKATIYDIIVMPKIDKFEDMSLVSMERKILEKELIRYRDFSLSAINAIECLELIESEFRI